MAIRIPWDKHETALLIDAWLRIENGSVSRMEAIAEISKLLRQKAMADGISIDETFRNENGISWQLNSIHRLMQHQPDAERHNTKIFVDMVKLYDSDREQFDAILQEAKEKGGGERVKTREELFADWLSAHVSPGRLSECYMAIPAVEEYAQDKKIISGSLYDVTDPEISVKIINAISTDRVFRYQQKSKIRSIVDVAQQFHRYVKETRKAPQLLHEQEDSDVDARHLDGETDESASDDSKKATVENASADTVKEKEHTSDDEAPKKTLNPETEWDRFDTAIMIEACLQAKEGRITRFNAACELSKMFREKAIRGGYVIDDKYRNENMILWQLISLGQLLNGLPDVKNPSTEVFVEMVELYSADKERFYEILQEAKGQAPLKKTKKDLFLEWLSERASSDDLPKYEAAIPDVEAFAQKNGVFVGSVYDVSDPIIFRQLVRALVSDEEFCVSNKELFRRYLDVAMKFYSFLTDYEFNQQKKSDAQPNADEEKESLEETTSEEDVTVPEQLSYASENAVETETVSEDPVEQVSVQTNEQEYGEDNSEQFASEEYSDRRVVDYSHPEKYENTKPISVTYSGKEYQVDSWRRLYVGVCRLLIRDYPSAFSQLCSNFIQGTGSPIVFDKSSSKKLFQPACIANGYYVEARIDTTHILRNIKMLLMACLLDYEKLEICYEKTEPEVIRFITIPAQDGATKSKEDPMDENHSHSATGAVAEETTVDVVSTEQDAPIVEDTSEQNTIQEDNHTVPDPSDDSLSEEPDSQTDNESGNAKDTTGQDVSTDKSDVQVIDFSLEENYQFTKPVSIYYFGDTYPITSWRKLYVTVCKLLYIDHPDVFSGQNSDGSAKERPSFLVDETAAKSFVDPVFIKKDCYIETQVGTIRILRCIRRLLDACHVEYDNLQIRYIKTGQVAESVSEEQSQGEKPKNGEVSNAATQRMKEESSVAETEMPLDGKTAFTEWMREQGVADHSIRTGLWALSRLNEFAAKAGFVSGSIYDVTTPATLNRIWNMLMHHSPFMEFKRRNSVVSFAFNKYVAFRGGDQQPEQKMDSPSSVTQQIPPTSTLFFHFYIKNHPGKAEFGEWLRKNGAPDGSIKSYTDGLAVMGKFLLENGLEDRHIFSIRGIARLERIYSVIQKNDAYRQMRTGATASLDLFALKKYINFRKNNASDELDEKTAERFFRVLADNFENGFRVRSVIDRNRFKQFYADLYGEEPHQNDDVLVETIKKIGELQDDRVFFREKGASGDLLDDIQADIAKAFRQGATCVYISCVYEKYREALAAQLQIYNEELLCEQLLATCYGDYRQIRQYFCLSSRAADVAADVNAIMKQSQNPMTYSQIHDVLWYIPVDQIKHTLVSSDGMVNVAPETYFYAYNLPVSAVELEHIAELLHAKLAQKSFITDAELRELINVNCPSVAINTEAFSTMGLRKALSVLLRNRFNFNGSRISERGKSLNVWQEIESFCNSHDRFSLEELQEFAKELQSQINWEAVFSKSIRLSQTEFVRKDLVPFDVRATDEALDRLVGGDYVALKDFTLFLQLPVLAVKWNVFVLEGYVSQFSREFTLLHTGYSVNECCGAIVRRSSAIKDFKSLLTDVLAHSPSWKTQDDALQLLARKGYLLQRRFTEIDAVVTQARIARDSEKDDADV